MSILKQILVALALSAAILPAQRGGGGGNAVTPLGSLKRVALPAPTGLELYVRDQAALVALGKAFFWDMQAGSDGRTACASCHFHAGADHRVRNQITGANATANLIILLSCI